MQNKIYPFIQNPRLSYPKCSMGISFKFLGAVCNLFPFWGLYKYFCNKVDNVIKMDYLKTLLAAIQHIYCLFVVGMVLGGPGCTSLCMLRMVTLFHFWGGFQNGKLKVPFLLGHGCLQGSNPFFGAPRMLTIFHFGGCPKRILNRRFTLPRFIFGGGAWMFTGFKPMLGHLGGSQLSTFGGAQKGSWRGHSHYQCWFFWAMDVHRVQTHSWALRIDGHNFPFLGDAQKSFEEAIHITKALLFLWAMDVWRDFQSLCTRGSCAHSKVWHWK